MPEAMLVWWTRSSSIADAVSDLISTSLTEAFWKKCIREFVPRLPYFGLDYWIKFRFGDWLQHLAPSLAGYTITGTGCFQHLKQCFKMVHVDIYRGRTRRVFIQGAGFYLWYSHGSMLGWGGVCGVVGWD